MRPPPTTAEIVESWALRDEHRAALQEQGATLGFGQLHGAILRSAQALRQLGVRRGDCVAVGVAGFTWPLVMMIAAEGVGASVVAFQAQGDPDIDTVLSVARWVLSPEPLPEGTVLPAGTHFALVDASFLNQPLSPPAWSGWGWEPLALHETQRITRTSGSTGRSKFMSVSRQAEEHWIRSSLDLDPYHRGTRLLIAGPLVMHVAFTRACACLRQGGLVLAGSGEMLPHFAPTDVWGLPMHIERLLAEAPAGWTSGRPASVSTVGGAVGAALRERMRRSFGTEPVNRYGSNEAGAISDFLTVQGEGSLSQGVDVRILDAEGREVPDGQFGQIAVRTPALADGYIGLPEETARRFVGGWFLSADVGAMVGYRRLRLAGRDDDLLVVGGLKIPASAVEDALRQRPAVADCAALTVNAADGAVSLGIAIVVAAGASPEEAQQQILGAVNLGTSVQARVLMLPALPRVPAGKVDRRALLALFQDPSVA